MDGGPPVESSSLPRLYFPSATPTAMYAAPRAPGPHEGPLSVDNLLVRAVRMPMTNWLKIPSTIISNAPSGFTRKIHCGDRSAPCLGPPAAGLTHGPLRCSRFSFAYKSFYDKYSNSPVRQSALKLAEQREAVPLSHSAHILARPRSTRWRRVFSKVNPASISVARLILAGSWSACKRRSARPRFWPQFGATSSAWRPVVRLHSPGNGFTSGITLSAPARSSIGLAVA